MNSIWEQQPDGSWRLILDGNYLCFDEQVLVTEDMLDLTTKQEFAEHVNDDERHTSGQFKRFCYNYPEWYFDGSGEPLLANRQDMVTWQWMVGIGLNPYGRVSGSDQGTFGGIRVKLDNFKRHGILSSEGLTQVRTVTMQPHTAQTGGWISSGKSVYLNLAKIKKYAPRPKQGDKEQEESDGFRFDGEVGENIIMEVVAENHLMEPLPETFSNIPDEVLTEAELCNVEWLGCSVGSIDTEANLGRYVTWAFKKPIDLSETERVVMFFSVEEVKSEADFKRKFRQKGKASLENSGSGGYAGNEQQRRGILGFEIFFARFIQDNKSIFDEGEEITEYDQLQNGKEPMFYASGNQRACAVRLKTNHYNAIEGENLATGWAMNEAPHKWKVDAVYDTSAGNKAYYCPLFIFNYDPPMKNRYLATEDIGEIAATDKSPLFDDTPYTPSLTSQQMAAFAAVVGTEVQGVVNVDAAGLSPDARYLVRFTAEQLEKLKAILEEL